MKVKIKSSEHKNEIMLSIGMIVKNEEKVLRRCLESLKPLMAAVPSELIIADTGSDDNTIEIAKEYTDNVYSIEWKNDFSYARNTTVEKAKGLWYMHIDADEYLDSDINEIISFFHIPELYNHYRTVEIPVRNYSNEAKTRYADCVLARFHRLVDKSVRFEGSVHEAISINNPVGEFSVILHHTGYCYSSAQQQADKKDRNMKLMREEYKKNSTDLRMLCFLIDGSILNKDEAEKYISEAIEIAKHNRTHLYSNIVFMQAIDYYRDYKPEYALKLYDEYYSDVNDRDNYVASVGIKMLKADTLASLSRFEEASKIYDEYFELYYRYKANQLNNNDYTTHFVYGLTDSEYISCICTQALCLDKMKQYQKAQDCLSKINISDLKNEDYTKFLGVVRKLGINNNDYNLLAQYYRKANDTKDSNKSSLSLYMLESAYYSLNSDAERYKFAKSVVESKVTGKYVDLMEIVLENEENVRNDKLVKLFQDIDNWKEGYNEAIYLAIKNKIDISEHVLKMETSQFREKMQVLAEKHDDFAQYVFEYGVPHTFTNSIKQFYWILSAYEKAVSRSFKLNDDTKYKLYLCYISLLSDYVCNIYNPELLNDEDVEVIPPLHKFGYFMGKAQKALKNGDSVGYIRTMKSALKSCESMKDLVEFMLHRFQKSIEM